MCRRYFRHTIKDNDIMRKAAILAGIFALMTAAPIMAHAETKVTFGGSYNWLSGGESGYHDEEDIESNSVGFWGRISRQVTDGVFVWVGGEAFSGQYNRVDHFPARYETITELVKPASCELQLVKSKCSKPKPTCVLTPEITRKRKIMVQGPRTVEKTHDFDVREVSFGAGVNIVKICNTYFYAIVGPYWRHLSYVDCRGHKRKGSAWGALAGIGAETTITDNIGFLVEAVGKTGTKINNVPFAAVWSARGGLVYTF